MPEPRRRPAVPDDQRAAQRTTLGPVHRTRLTDDVAARLVAGIIDGRFKLGERLPAERDLARYLDVGRPTLREALVTLRAVGLLEVRHGDGTFVVHRQADFLAKALSWVVLLDAPAANEIDEARRTLESAVGAFEDNPGLASRNQILARVLQAVRLLARHPGHHTNAARQLERRAPALQVANVASRRPLRIGMITPSSNTMVEPITAAVTAPFQQQLSIHYARIPVTRIALDRPSQQQFDLDAMISAARLLADARVHAICWNGISAAWKGSASDRWICEAIQRETGIPATSATLAQLEAFRAYGVRRYALAVPYRDDVRKAIIRVYGEEGFDCVNSAHLGISVNFKFAEIPAETLRTLVRRADSPTAEAVVVHCTNLGTARLVEQLEAELGKPVFDSLLLALWHPLRMLGWNQPIPHWGRVLGE